MLSLELSFDYVQVTSEAAAMIKHDSRHLPEIIRLARDEDLRWRVVEVLDHNEGDEAGEGIEDRYRLRVIGPEPGDPWTAGEFVMIATNYTDRTYWWIRPEARGEGGS